MRAPNRAPQGSPLAWAAWAAILVIVIAALTAMLFAMLTSPGTPCASVDATSITKETAGELRSEGWYPNPTDGYERLYSPGCLTSAE